MNHNFYIEPDDEERAEGFYPRDDFDDFHRMAYLMGYTEALKEVTNAVDSGGKNPIAIVKSVMEKVIKMTADASKATNELK